MAGIIYVLTNPAMPGLIKIGRSDGPIEQRLKQLDTTSVPLPFECFCAIEVDDPPSVEKSLHLAFGDHRMRASREFFRLSPDKPLAILRLLERRNLTPQRDVVETADDQSALDAERRRRSNFSFAVAGIPVGAVLTSVFDEEIVCTVRDQRWVEFRNEEHSLSSAGLVVAHEKGFLWKALQGPAYWKYGDATLSELREAAENAPPDP